MACHTGVPQIFLKHAIPDYLVRGTDLFTLRLSNIKMTTANTTIAVWCEWIKIILIFSQQKIHFLVCRKILSISLCVPQDEKGQKWLAWHFHIFHFNNGAWSSDKCLRLRPLPQPQGHKAWALGLRGEVEKYRFLKSCYSSHKQQVPMFHPQFWLSLH